MTESTTRPTQAQERLYWNTIRGIAIFLMLWGHCIQYCSLGSFPVFENGMFRAIYSFHMPLFMIVSGYLFSFSFEKRSLRGLLANRAKSMLWPIVGGTVLNNLLLVIPTLVLSHGQKLALFDGTLVQGWEYSLWFLWSVLACSLAVGIACKTGKTPLQRGIYLALGTGFIALFPNANENLFMYPFFLTGFFWARHRKAIVQIFRKWKYGVLLLFPILLSFYRTEHYIYVTPMFSAEKGLAESLRIDLFRFLIGLAGSGCCFILTSLVLDRLPADGRTPKLLTALSRLGENSLPIYCLSVSLLSGYLPHIIHKCMEPFGYNLLAENWVFYNLVFTPLLAAIYCAGLLAVVRLLRKTGIHTLFFGR